MCLVTFNWEYTDAEEKIKKFKELRSLSWVVVELTEACNFNCKWCYANAGGRHDAEHMSWENSMKLVDVLAKAGVKQITCGGGEPTLYPYLDEFIRYARGKGLIVHMITNGYLLTKERTNELKDAGLSQVQIDIDSLDPKKHDAIRGMPDSWERAVQALKNAKDCGMSCVAQTVLTKENENEILDIFKFAREEIGVQRCRVWDMTLEGAAKDQAHLLPTNYLKTLEELVEYATATDAVSVETFEPLFPLINESGLKVIGGFCVAKTGLYTYLTKDGDVLFCATCRDKLYNIFDMGDEDMATRHPKKIKQYLEGITFHPNCLSCTQLSNCRGGCSARCQENELDYVCRRG